MDNVNDTDAPAVARPLARAAGAAVRWRAIGLVGSKLLGLLRSVLLAWLLVPDDFGLFAIAVLPLDTMLAATDVGMLPALVQSPQIDARDFSVAWTIGIVRAVIVGLVLFAAAPLVAGLLGDIRATPIVQLIALRPLIASLKSIKLAQLERELQFRAMTVVDLGTAAVHTIVTVALAKSFGAWAMALGLLGGAVSGVVVSYWQAPCRPRFAFDTYRASSLLRFGRWVLLGGIVAMLGEWILVAAITHTAGTAALGRYSLAASIALTPASMVGSLIGGVAFAAHARVGSDTLQAARVFRASLVAMVVPVIPVCVIVVALAPTIVSRVLAERWQGLAPVIQLLAIAGILGLMFDASTSLLAGVGRPRASTLLSVVYTCVVALLGWPLAVRFGIEGAAGARVVAEIGLAVAAILLVRSAIGRSVQGLGSPLLCVIGSAATGAVVALATLSLSPSPLWLAAAGLVGLAAVAVTLVGLDRLLGSGILRDASFVLSVRR